MKPGYEPKTLGGALAWLGEEASEVASAVFKTLRFAEEWGDLQKALFSYNPDVPVAERETNLAWIVRESSDLRMALTHALDLLDNQPCISGEACCAWRQGKTFTCARCKKLVCYCQGGDDSLICIACSSRAPPALPEPKEDTMSGISDHEFENTSQAIQVHRVDQETGTLSLQMSDGEVIDVKILGVAIERLSSVTAALAARITQTPVHPAEHVLDASRALYGEEQGGKSICVECDQCKVRGPGAISGEIAKRLARLLGWSCGVDYDYCPPHSQSKGLLPDGNQEKAPAPAVLSIPDSILCTRLDWLSSQITSGVTAEAALLNAPRLGLRPMLTLLAGQFHYSPATLAASVDELRTRGAALPEAFRSDPDGSTWNWIAELFTRVREQDNGIA